MDVKVGRYLSSMSLEGGLFTCDDHKYWRLVLNAYWEVLAAKGKKQKELVTLDKWYQEELPAAIAERKERYLTREDLVKLMAWKLSRGKFRPRLQQLVATNSSEAVESCTGKAFGLLPDVAAAITELSRLKAVGPATASAILAAGAPEAAAVMTDEAMESIPGLGPIQYTLKHYMIYLSKIQSCVEKLNKTILAAGAPEAAAVMTDEAMESIPGLGPIQYTLKHYMIYLSKIQSCVEKLNKTDAEKTWMPHLVEKCLWAWAVAKKLQLPLFETLGAEREEAGCNAEAGEEPSKKRKRK
ncbi:PREDICTED: uncharacterized protein LOC107118524 [Gekko japonicus]|uniref:Uncharacterized protein LOC107118524 n=1 Tax=Gekko japonicus TaxID=146911 RepID=A0ABM1KRN0_GEKJA|nr:PREDICTED: uncharacterized protein LOC107118524 [Gekko japonicus]